MAQGSKDEQPSQVLPRITSKAGKGLASIPRDKFEWLEIAQSLHLQKRTLAGLCQNGPFSADHAPGDSILTLRPLWPSREAHQSATDAVVKTGSFFTQDHVDGARILLRTPSLHFEKLDLLFRLLCPGDKPCAPLDSSITLADGLGCFSHVVFLHDRLLQLLSHEPHRQAHNGDGRGGGGGSFDETNGNGGLNGHSEDAKDKDQNGKGRGGPVYGGTGIAQVANLNPSAVTPSRRTPTEKVMVDFLATLMACIAGQIQPFSRTPVCFADAFELTFRFGPISGRSQDGEAEAGNELSKQPAFFCARIDGGIPFAWIQDEGREFFAVFKVKESQRSEDDVEARAQHTMEHAAVIWERHEGYQAKERSETKGSYHNLMFSQDGRQIFIGISSYDDDYLDYLFGPGSAAVIPSDMETAPFLKIQEFGPLLITEEEDLRSLSLIVLSLLVWQLES